MLETLLTSIASSLLKYPRILMSMVLCCQRLCSSSSLAGLTIGQSLDWVMLVGVSKTHPSAVSDRDLAVTCIACTLSVYEDMLVLLLPKVCHSMVRRVQVELAKVSPFQHIKYISQTSKRFTNIINGGSAIPYIHTRTTIIRTFVVLRKPFRNYLTTVLRFDRVVT